MYANGTKANPKPMTKCSIGKTTSSPGDSGTTAQSSKPTKPARIGREHATPEDSFSFPLILENDDFSKHVPDDDRRVRLAKYPGNRKVIIRVKSNGRDPRQRFASLFSKQLREKLNTRNLRHVQQRSRMLDVPKIDPRMQSDHYKFVLQDALSKKLLTNLMD